MNNIYFTPGPSQLYHTVPFHLQNAMRDQVASLSHRSSKFKEIVKFTKEQLTAVLDLPADYQILFTASANEVWERIIQNLVIESSHHYVNGAFSRKFFNFSRQYQLSSTMETAEDGREFSFEKVPSSAELLSVTMNETSIGYGFDSSKLKELRDKHPDKLIAADLVSASPAISFNFSLVDTAYFSVQKCFGLPAGLGVWIVGPNAIAAFEKKSSLNHVTGSYHDLGILLDQHKNHQTPETPNMLGIYLLGKVAEDMNNRGIKMIQNETRYKSTLLYQAINEVDWCKSFIDNKINRSHTVIVGETHRALEFIDHMKKLKMVIGSGYGNHKSHHFRIANFPAHSKEQIELLTDMIKQF